MKQLLLIALLLIAPVAGAERIIECDNGEVVVVSDKCRLIDYYGDNVKTDTEKWRLECQNAKTLQEITAYCTRYNSALLEEKLK